MSFARFKRKIEQGDTIILYVNPFQIYAIEVKPQVLNRKGILVEYTFQAQYGALRVMDLVGKEFGSKVILSKGYAYVLHPTPELWTLTLPHRTQILYTPDISLVIMELDIVPGSVVCEAGTGSGSLSHAFLRTIGDTGRLYSCDFHQERVEVAQKEFDRHGLSSRVLLEKRDVCEQGWKEEGVADAVFLDLPKPWEALLFGIKAMKKSGGRICSFSPCVEQVTRTCELMKKLGLTEINTMECLQREFQMKNIVVPPVVVKKVPLSKMKYLNHNKEEMHQHKKRKGSNDGETALPLEIPLLDKTAESVPQNVDVEPSLQNVNFESSVQNVDTESILQKVTVEPSSQKFDVESTSQNVNVESTSQKINVGSSSQNGPASSLPTTTKDSSETCLENSSMDAPYEGNSSESYSANLRFKENPDNQKNPYKFRSAVPLIKIPGHTGYLTFATVPPFLSTNFQLQELS